MSPESDPIGPGWLVAVVVAAAVLYVANTTTPGQYRTDEVRYIGSGLTVVETGDWVVPMSDGRVRLKKPPLQTWMVATSYRLFGVGLWQARLPSVLAGTGVIALAAWLAFLLFDSRRVALYAAAIAVGSSFLLRQAHWAITDAALTCFTVGAWCGFALTVRGHARGAWLAWLFMGLAFMQKGPVGVGLPLVGFGAWLLLESRARPVSWRPLYDPVGLVLFAAIVLPWPLLAIARLGMDGFFGPVGKELGHHVTWSPLDALELLGRYPTDLVRGLLPWSVLLLFGLRAEGRTNRARVVWLWLAAFWLVFSLVVHQHRWRYMVPAMPAIAILAGHALDALQRRCARSGRADPELLLARLGPPVWFGLHAIWGGALVYTALRLLEVPSATRAALGVIALCLGFGAATLWLQRRAAPHAWVVVAGVGIAVVETVGTISYKADVPTAATFFLVRDHLRDRGAALSIAEVNLGFIQRVWGWVALGRSFPGYAVPEDAGREAWDDVVRHDVLLLSAPAFERMPAELRGDYREVVRRLSVDKDPEPVWRPGHVAARRADWLEDAVEVVLLERVSASAADRAGGPGDRPGAVSLCYGASFLLPRDGALVEEPWAGPGSSSASSCRPATRSRTSSRS